MTKEEKFKATTISGQTIEVNPTIEGFSLFKRGDCVLLDKLDYRGNKTGEKEFVFVVGFTHCRKCYPPDTIWFGDAEKAIKEEAVVVFGRQWTESLLDQMIKIETPNKQLRDFINESLIFFPQFLF